MGYKVTYGPEPSASKRKKAWNPVTLIILGAVLFCLIPGVQEVIRELLLPQEYSESISQAFAVFQYRIEQGSGVADAVTAFCREVFHHAQIPG